MCSKLLGDFRPLGGRRSGRAQTPEQAQTGTRAQTQTQTQVQISRRAKPMVKLTTTSTPGILKVVRHRPAATDRRTT